ncbi:RNA polymerase sigma factor [Agrilutibacter solisilvae]|uniref:RNA polymerase sigma factor n=1 Tax=Agrilutibacter solisilvae TaxID=2763317 RepID=A0A975AQP2_9GAMM|nr:sigma-70 family RNA polymerase sigma factor [Lysobacter solisilvae]QSX77134.1 sigma-70 family RNA polymerase sigma factor [Lysobacter solisilvae]
MTALTVEDLILRELPAATNGDPHAYGRIVAASQNTVTAVALAITRDVGTSEDIAQEAFLNAWQNLQRLQNPSSFLPWLRQITRNLAHDHLRGVQRRPRAADDAEAAIEAAADPQPGPADRIIEHEQQAVAADLISALPDESREVLLLYYREGQSSQQVAHLLGLSDAAVRKRLSRARGSVREDLMRRFGEFARNSAPSAAFATVVTTALGSLSKPASAAGMVAAGSGVAGATLGKLFLGFTAGLGAGIAGGLAGLYFCARQLQAYADTDLERTAIRRWVRQYAFTSVALSSAIMAAAVLAPSWQLLSALTLGALPVLNYQLLVPLPRMMNPMRERDARRRPEGAGRRALAYRLVWGVTGVLITNIAMIGGLVLLVLGSGHIHG